MSGSNAFSVKLRKPSIVTTRIRRKHIRYSRHVWRICADVKQNNLNGHLQLNREYPFLITGSPYVSC